MLVGSEELTALLDHMGTPDGVRFFRGVESAEVGHLVVHGRLCGEPPAWRLPHASGQFTSRGTTVPMVLLPCRLTQIGPPVLGPVAVFVVNLFHPFAGLHGPDDAVRPKRISPTQHDHDVAVVTQAAGGLSGPARIPSKLVTFICEMVQRALLPGKAAGFWFVDETLVQVGG